MSKYRVWYDGDPEHTNFDSLAQALKYVRKTKVLDESNSGLEECVDGYWDEWMDSDDQEIHDHLYMYGGKSPYLKKSAEKPDPVRPSIMDTVSFSREDLIASIEEEDDDEEENEEDAYDEIIDPDEEVLDEEGLDERLMNVIGVSPKTTTETTTETTEEEFIGEDEMSEFEEEDDDDLEGEEDEEEK